MVIGVCWKPDLNRGIDFCHSMLRCCVQPNRCACYVMMSTQTWRLRFAWLDWKQILVSEPPVFMLRSPVYNLFSRANWHMASEILSYGHYAGLHFDQRGSTLADIPTRRHGSLLRRKC